MLFERTQQARRRAEHFAGTLAELHAALLPWPEEAAAIGQLQRAYQARLQDYFDQPHKFCLAVVGQVKAGKSTFLNALLFGGQNVLPQAASPKTSVLTRLEYAAEPCVTVEYYTTDDWAALQRTAAVPLDSPAVHGAREILLAAAGRSDERDACAAKGSETFACPDEGDLAALLEDTVGGGKRAAFVKCVTLGLCRDELRELSVVDTPGLNDPLPARSQRTMAFLQTCDAAFFLSHSGYFLDETDLALLTEQLARKGVRRIRLIASRFDGALADEGVHPAEAQRVRAALCAHARIRLDAWIEHLRRSGTDALAAQVLAECREPLFVSAVARQMADADPAAYTPMQQAVAGSLFGTEQPDPAVLRDLAGFDAVERAFARFVDEKDATLAQKADEFAAVAQAELRAMLERLCESRSRRMGALAAQEGEAARAAAHAAEESRRITLAVTERFDRHLALLDDRIRDAATALRRMGGDAPHPAERRDVTLHTESYTVSDAQFWKPWTWGRKHREYNVYESENPYWEAADTLEFLTAFQQELPLLWADLYAPLVDTAALQQDLLLLVRQTLRDTGGEVDTAADLVRRALGRITAPRLRFDTEAQRKALSAQFPDRVAKAEQRRALQHACAEAVDQAVAAAMRQLDDGAEKFRRTVESARQDLCDRLLQPVNVSRREAEQQRLRAQRLRAQCQEFIETARRGL